MIRQMNVVCMPLFSRHPYPVGKSSTIDGCITLWFCGFLLYLNLSLERFGWRIRILEQSRTFYSNSLKSFF